MIELLTAILVIVTGLYAWFTYDILQANKGVLKEMRQQQEAMYRPYITIKPVLFPDIQMFYLQIENTGMTAAHNLSMHIDKDFYKLGKVTEDNNLKNYVAFQDRKDTFAPNEKFLFYLAPPHVLFNEEYVEVTPNIFKITAKYEYAGKKATEVTTVDLRPYLNSTFPHDPIVSKLNEINKSIKNIQEK